MSYSISARGYLARAKQRLKDETPEALFYAAFELRCCVESRQEEYATALDFLKTKIKPWNIGKTAMTLQRVFDSKKIAHITLVFGNAKQFDLYYTPVTEGLHGAAVKTLGALLHCMPIFKVDDDPFWMTTRTELIDIYRRAWITCQGTLLLPPLVDHPMKVEHPSDDLADWLMRAGAEKLQLKMVVRYLDRPPSDWKCDL